MQCKNISAQLNRLIVLGSLLLAQQVMADEIQPDTPPVHEDWAIHGQITNITQHNSHFNAPYGGTNSLRSNGPTEETTDLTLFLGVRPWQGGEFWINGEVDQGFGLSNTFGVAGFPSGGAYKVGANRPYIRLPRAFLRQTIGLGGDAQSVEADANQLAGAHSANNVTLTVGKFAVTDIFDNNSYAHDPRADFLNWSMIDGSAFDYAADSWGYTYGFAAEWNQDWWTLRAGYFELSQEPNGKAANFNFRENSPMLEAEARYDLAGKPGKVKLLGFVNRGNMGAYKDATSLANQTGGSPDVSQVRHFATRTGYVINLEQTLSSDTGLFARLSRNQGSKETYEFTDANQSASFGVSVKGASWKRENDTLGLACVVNALSGEAKDYFAAGGLGVLIGDGKLNYAPEKILEAYYAFGFGLHYTASVDYQHVNNPAYNHDRGPVSIYSLRLHAQF